MEDTSRFSPHEQAWRRQVGDLTKLLLSGKTAGQARHTLLQFDRDVLIDTLKELLEDDDLAARDGALRLLMEFAPSQGVDRVIPLLHDPMPEWRWYLCGALSKYGDERAVLPLVDVLLHDPHDDTRYMAAMALERIGDTRALPALYQVQQTDQGTDYEGRTIADAASDAVTAILQRHSA